MRAQIDRQTDILITILGAPGDGEVINIQQMTGGAVLYSTFIWGRGL